VARLSTGGTPSKARDDWWRGSVPWASPKDIKRPRLQDTEDHITQEAAEQGSRVVPAKTIFAVVRGMILAKEFPVAITEVPMAFNQDMKAIVVQGSVDPDYLMYAITARKDALVQEIGTSAHGTRRLGGSSLEGLLLPAPPAEEQRQIAAALRTLDDRAESSERRLSLLRSLFSSLLHLLMTGRKRVTDLSLGGLADG
jgi:type I restriction enzyme S subunit